MKLGHLAAGDAGVYIAVLPLSASMALPVIHQSPA